MLIQYILCALLPLHFGRILSALISLYNLTLGKSFMRNLLQILLADSNFEYVSVTYFVETSRYVTYLQSLIYMYIGPWHMIVVQKF